MYQIKVAERIKIHVLLSIFVGGKSCRLWDNVEKYFRAGPDSWPYGSCALHAGYLGLQIRGGDPKKTGFSLKKEDLFTFRTKKHLIPFKNSSLEAIHLSNLFSHCVKHLWNWWSLILLSAYCEAVFTSSTVANIFHFNGFFPLSGVKRNHRGLGPVNRVGGERRSIPERPNTGSQTKLCDLGPCHDGETDHPISMILGVFFAHSLNRLKTSK